MSHYTVLVVVPKGGALDSVLAPYQEYDGDDRTYVEFEDKTEDIQVQYEDDQVACWPTEDGTLVASATEGQAVIKAVRAGLAEDHPEWTPGELEQAVWEWADQHQVLRPAPDVMTFEEYADSQVHAEYRAGRWGYYSNPHGYWDWYDVGGRWGGMLPLIAEPLFPHGDYYNEPWEGRDWRGVDWAHATDVDWQRLRQDPAEALALQQAFRQALDAVDLAQVAGLEQPKAAWKLSAAPNESLRQTFRCEEDYLRYWAAEKPPEWPWLPDGSFIRLMMYGTKREVTQATLEEAPVYACVDECGDWHQKGRMGWFGMSDEDGATHDYNAQFWQMVGRLTDAHLVYLVDCHI